MVFPRVRDTSTRSGGKCWVRQRLTLALKLIRFERRKDREGMEASSADFLYLRPHSGVSKTNLSSRAREFSHAHGNSPSFATEGGSSATRHPTTTNVALGTARFLNSQREQRFTSPPRSRISAHLQREQLSGT